MSILAQAQARVRWQRQQGVPLGGAYNVYRIAGEQYTRVNPSAIPAWPDGEQKRGYGLGPYGLGQYGYGQAQGCGYGLGPYGLGRYGYGIPSLMEFVTPELDDGTYTFGVIGVDPAGNAAATAEQTDQVTLAGVPDPPGIPTADAYDDGTDTLTLSWDLSRHDQAA